MPNQTPQRGGNPNPQEGNQPNQNPIPQPDRTNEGQPRKDQENQRPGNPSESPNPNRGQPGSGPKEA